MPQLQVMALVNEANRITEEYSTLSNVYRTMILAYLIARNQGSWSEIKKFLESNLGSVNPNTLHFHLKALIQRKFVVAVGSEEKPSYQIGELPKEIRQHVGRVANLIGSD